MNYRHAFHAGNFADVHKHAVLVLILLYLRLKPAAFRVIDSHAGAGRYDLFGPEPTRGGEWRDGIARIWDAARRGKPPPPLAAYLDAVAALNRDGHLRVYPGSPVIARGLLRPQDRLIACEVEPSAGAALAAALRGDSRARVIAIDGWTALKAYVPPKERRGLLLIDPPFEDSADFMRLSAAIAAAHRKWPSGIYMLWYPIKDRQAGEALARRLQRLAIAKMLRCELRLDALRQQGGLAGSGLIVANPPYTLEADLKGLLPVLCKMLTPEAVARIDWLAQEQ